MENILPTCTYFVVKTVSVWIPLLGYNANSTAVFGLSLMITAKNLIDNAYYFDCRFH